MKFLIFTLAILAPTLAHAQIAVFDSANAARQAFIQTETVQQGVAIAEQLSTLRDQYNTVVDTYNSTIDSVEKWQRYADRMKNYQANVQSIYNSMGNLNQYLAEGDHYDDQISDYENIGNSVDTDYPSYKEGVAAIQSGRTSANRQLQEELRSSLIASKEALSNLEEDNAEMLALAEEHERAETMAQKQTVANKIALKNLEVMQSLRVMKAHELMIESRSQYKGTSKKLPEGTQDKILRQLIDGGYSHWELSPEEKAYAERFKVK